jgi:hypothetical protein
MVFFQRHFINAGSVNNRTSAEPSLYTEGLNFYVKYYLVEIYTQVLRTHI